MRAATTNSRTSGTGVRLVLLWALLAVTPGCGRTRWNTDPTGQIQADAIRESSGVVVSRQFDNVLWTHNDSDNPPFLYAIDEQGRLIQSFELPGVQNYDWEDIALDESDQLHILDNGSLRDPEERSFIHSFDEPSPFGDGSVGKVRTLTFRYPDGPHDCEALLAWGRHLYLVTKSWDGSLPRIYRVPAEAQGEVTAELLGEVPVHTMVTAGDASLQGRGIVLASYRALLLWEGDDDPATLLQQAPLISHLNARQIEAVAWNERDLILTNEQRDIFEISIDELKRNEAPFFRTPRSRIPRLEESPTVKSDPELWKDGQWLKVETPAGDLQLARVGWTDDALYLGVDLPEGLALRMLDSAPAAGDWFRPGALYVLINPDGHRPMVYGQNDRCIVVGARTDGRPAAIAHTLQPGTLIADSESRPEWVQVEREGNHLLLRISMETPGFEGLGAGREIGFNLILIENDGTLVSWAPLTRRFTWDSPSVWGLLKLDD